MRNWWNALLVIIAVGCGDADVVNESAPQQGALNIGAVPAGEVLVDGESVGTAPIQDLAVDAGEHAVTVRREGFVDWSGSVLVEAGKPASVTAQLIVEDPTDPVALAVMAASLELEEVAVEADETLRSAKSAPVVVPLYPRGDLRPTDMDEFRIDVTDEFEPGGTLEFRKGSTVLSSQPFDPESFASVDALPDEVLAKTKPGQTITWGYYPTKGKPVTAKFKIRKPDRQLSKRIEKLNKRMEAQPELLQVQMRAQLWLNKRLYYAAYRDARSVVNRAQQAPESLVIMQAALRRMNLKGTALWTEIEDKVERLPSRFRPRMGSR